jgi:hypothetical protein
MIKTIATCDRCGKEWEWSLFDEGSPNPEKRIISGIGEKDLCAECAIEFDAIIDTVTRLKNLLIDELTPEWAFSIKAPFKITVLVYSRDRDQIETYSEYSDLVVKSK